MELGYTLLISLCQTHFVEIINKAMNRSILVLGSCVPLLFSVDGRSYVNKLLYPDLDL